MDNKTIIFCGGGTGGHYYPLMAIKNELGKKIRSENFHYIGSKYGIESRKIDSENINNLLIPIKGFSRSFSLYAIGRNFMLIFQIFFGYIRVAYFFIMNMTQYSLLSGLVG